MTAVAAGLVDVFRELASGRRSWPLFLHGPVGTGKTCAVLSLCDFVDTAAYATVEDLCDRQMEDGGADLWEAVRTKDLAVLDELGERERVGDLQHTVVKKFTDAREIHAGRVAVYVSNLGPEGIATLYDDRVASRVLCGTCFELVGDDRRLSE